MWLPVSVESTGLHSLVSFLPHFSFLDFFPLWKLEIKYCIFLNIPFSFLKMTLS